MRFKEKGQVEHYDDVYQRGSNKGFTDEDYANKPDFLLMHCVLDRLGISATNILEIGCGDGLLTGILLRIYPNSVVTALDISPEAIEVIKDRFSERVSEERLRPICFSDVDYLAEKRGSFDLIIGSGILHHVDKNCWDLLFKGLYRNLKNSGKVVFVPEPNSEGLLSIVWAVTHFLYSKMLGDDFNIDCEKGTYDMKPGMISQKAKNAGFSNTEIKPYKIFSHYISGVFFNLNKMLVKFSALTPISRYISIVFSK